MSISLTERVAARINDLINRRSAIDAELNAIAADPEARGLDETQALARIAELRAEGERVVADLSAAQSQLESVRDAESRQAAAAAVRPAVVAEPVVRVKSEPTTYARHSRSSYFRDMAVRAAGLADDATLARLQRHAQEVDTELRSRPELRDISTTDAAGGTFVPPLWLIDDFVPVFRANRVTANLANSAVLPGGTDVVSIPTVTTGTLTAQQSTQNSAITTRDIVTSSTSAPVVTVGGYIDASLQVIEQSALAGGLDALLFRDLAADYARALDVLVITGDAASGNVAGIDTVAATSVTVGTVSATGIYASLADAINRMATNRFAPPEAIVMHPRRWFWLASRVDGSNRPLVVPTVNMPQNAMGENGANVGAGEGLVGQMFGIPVYSDPNITTTAGAGTNEDRIYVCRPSDWRLWEQTPRLQVFPDVKSAQLGIRYRLYNYFAFTTRTGQSTVRLTGLTTPTF